MNRYNIASDEFTISFKELTRHTYLSENFFLKSLDGIKRFDSPDKFVEEGKQFIYPLYIGANTLFHTELPSPPPKVVEYINKDRGIIVFIYVNEGNFYELNHFTFFSNWSSKFKFKKSNVFLVNSNLNINKPFQKYLTEGKILDNITYHGINYYESVIWNLPNTSSILKSENNKQIKHFLKKIHYKDVSNKQYYFNSLNRQPRPERIFLVTLLKSFEKISSLCSLSLGPQHIRPDSYKLEDLPIDSSIISDEKDLKAVQNFVSSNFNSIKKEGYTLDNKDLSLADSDNLNYSFYNNSYISVVVETETDARIMFLSEKTFKPIMCYHPFILLGSKHSLKTLKSLGYKTFSNWWDESYDNFDNIYDRIYYAFKEIKKICQLDKNSLSDMIKDMESVLEYNANHYMTNKHSLNSFYFIDKTIKIENKLNSII